MNVHRHFFAAVYGHSERDDIVKRVSIDTYYGMGRWLWTFLCRCLWTFGGRLRSMNVHRHFFSAVYGHSERDAIVHRMSVDTFYAMG